MKITDTRTVSSTALRRAGRTENEKGNFARALDSDEPATHVSRLSLTTPVGSVDSLLALQEVDPDGGKGALHRHAEDLLDELDELRHGLLTGLLTRHQLTRLKSLVNARRAGVTDPRLSEILDEIELRAAVEIAKYDAQL